MSPKIWQFNLTKVLWLCKKLAVGSSKSTVIAVAQENELANYDSADKSSHEITLMN